jgi:hypothetical protein
MNVEDGRRGHFKEAPSQLKDLALCDTLAEVFSISRSHAQLRSAHI